MNIQPTFDQNLKPDWKRNHREVYTPQFWEIYTPPRVGHGWKSDELLYQHFWNENNSPGMLRKTHREQQQKTYLRFLTEKGDLFINNSWVPIEHAWQKQCYSIENTVICHCFIWHLHFFFFFAWYCKTFLDGMQKWYKWKKSQCGDSSSLLWWVHSQLHTMCVHATAWHFLAFISHQTS